MDPKLWNSMIQMYDMTPLLLNQKNLSDEKKFIFLLIAFKWKNTLSTTTFIGVLKSRMTFMNSY